MDKSTFQILVEFWNRPDSVVPYGPSSETEIQTVENKYSLQLPKQFRDYLKKSAPKNDYSEDNDTQPHPFDDNHVTWWPLNQLKTIPEEYKNWETRITNKVILDDANFYLFFADYSIWCWAWAICCKHGDNYGRIIQVDEDPRFVADDFNSFIEKYVTYDMVYFD